MSNMDVAVRILAYDLASGGMQSFARSLSGVGASAMMLSESLSNTGRSFIETALAAGIGGEGLRVAQEATNSARAALKAANQTLFDAQLAWQQFKADATGSAAAAGMSVKQYSATLQQDLANARIAVMEAQQKVTQSEEAENAQLQALTQNYALLGAMVAGATADLLAFSEALKMAVDAGGQLQMATTMASIAIHDGAQNVNELEDAIVKLANSSQYQIAEVDQAFRVLGERGFSTSEIINDLGQNAINLGQALGVKAVDGANLLGQAFYLFRNQGLSTTQMADELTGAFYNNMNSVGALTQFLGMAGGTADALGVSMKSLLTFGDLLTPMFGSASSAGASLAYMMRNLAHPATSAMADEIKKLHLRVFDAKGQFVGLKSIMDQLFTDMKGMTTEQKIDVIGTLFNVRSGRAAMDLLSMTKSHFDATYKDIINRLGQSGQAQQDSAKINETAEGSWKRLTTTLNDFFAKAGVVVNQALVPIYDWLNKLLSVAQEHPQITQFFAAFLVGGTILAAVAVVVGGLIIAFSLFGAVMTPVLLVMLGIGVGAAQVAAAFEVLTGKGQIFSGWLSFFNPLIDAVRNAFQYLVNDIKKNQEAWEKLAPVGQVLLKVLGVLAVVVVALTVGPLVGLVFAVLAIVDGIGKFIHWIQLAIDTLKLWGPIVADVAVILRDVLTGNWGAVAKDCLQLQRDWNNAANQLAQQMTKDLKKQADQQAYDAEQDALKKKQAVLMQAADEADQKAKLAKFEADYDEQQAKLSKDKATKEYYEKAAAVARAQQKEEEAVSASAKKEAQDVGARMKDLQNNATDQAQKMALNVLAHVDKMSKGSVEKAREMRNKTDAELQAMKDDGIAAAVQLENGVKTKFQSMADSSGKWGYDLATNFANGINSGSNNAAVAAYRLASKVAATLQHSVPKEGPLSHDDEWGGHLVENFATGMLANAGLVEQAAIHVAGRVSGTLPRQAQLGITAAMQQAQFQQQQQSGGFYGREIVIQNVLDGRIIGETVLDLATGKLKLAGTGRIGRG